MFMIFTFLFYSKRIRLLVWLYLIRYFTVNSTINIYNFPTIQNSFYGNKLKENESSV